MVGGSVVVAAAGSVVGAATVTDVVGAGVSEELQPAAAPPTITAINPSRRHKGGIIPRKLPVSRARFPITGRLLDASRTCGTIVARWPYAHKACP